VIGNAGQLLLANALFLGAGIGVRRIVGSTHGSGRLSRLALSYLVGVASFGVLAQLLLVAGLSLTATEATALALGLLALGLVRRPRPEPRPAPAAWDAREIFLALAAAAMVLALGIRSFYEPLVSWDAWAFWIPKAKSIVLLHGLDGRFFAAPTTANADYPLLLPSIEATDFRFMGAFDMQVVHLQFWLLLVAFLGALPALLRDQVRPTLLRFAVVVLACAPSLALHAESAYADVPLAVFVALAGVAGWRWLVLRDRAALGLLAVFAAAALATKVEGRIFVGALVVTLAALAARDSVRRSAEVLGAGVGAALVGLLPWSIWLHMHHIHGAYHAELGDLGRHVDRIAPSLGSLLGHGLDPLQWLVVVPTGLAALLLAYRYGAERRTAAFVASTFLVSLGLLVVTYWATSYPFEWHLRTTADRVVIAPVLLVAALTPVLLESALRRAESP
jgi:hypothetical protein